ncbi:MAG: ATP-binding protein [PVC group bacterium]
MRDSVKASVRILLPLAIIILLTGFFADLIYRATEKQLVSDFGRDQLVLASSASKNIDFYLRSLGTDSLRLSRDLSAGGWKEGETEAKLAFTFASMFPRADVLLVADLSGQIRSVFPRDFFRGEERIALVETDQVLQGLKKGTPHIFSRSFRIRNKIRYLVFLASPVYQAALPGSPGGPAAVHDLDGLVCVGIAIDEIVENFILPDVTGSLPTIYIIDSDGTFLAHSTADVAGQNALSLAREGGKGLSLAGMGENRLHGILQGEESSGIVRGGDPGDQIVSFAFSTVGGSRWLVGVSRPLRQIAQSLNRIQKYYVSFLAFLLCLGFVSGYFLFRAHRARVRAEEEARVQRKLKESEERYRTLVESSPDGIITLDLEGGIADFNQTFASMLGYPPAEIAGLDLRRVVTPPGQEQIPLPAFLAEGRSESGIELQLYRPDGRILQISMDAALKFDEDGSPRHYFAVLRDVTQKKELEQKLAFADKMAGIGQLAAGVAHEFNNLLSLIRSSAEIVAHFIGDGKTRPEVLKIVKASDRGAVLVDGLLHFAGRKSGVREKIDPVQALEEVLELVAADFHTSGLTVRKEYSLVPEVAADKGQLQQVFLNLIINAREAMAREHTLTLRAGHQGDEVILEFENNGRPISAEALHHIFEPFYSSRESRRSGKRGTGLGLSISLGIIKAHGGTIAVASGEGRPTVFTVKLPAAS